MRMLTIFLLSAAAGLGADVAGAWRLAVVMFGEEAFSARLELKVDGDQLTGKVNDMTVKGTVTEDAVRFTVTRPNGTEFATFEGRLKSDGELAGTVHAFGEDAPWAAQRAAMPNAPPQTRTFEPTVFHRKFSGTIPPALHINPGDTVRTTTVDAGGRDAKGVRRSLGGNPETGPFYVEGALPGDTLVVKLNSVRLNRDTAGSGSRITPDALEPDYFRDAKFDEHFSSEWKLDREAGFASLAKPSEHLKNFRVKLRPMMGCIGVAPPDKQAFRSGWLGSWGGNMDYNGLREGATVYLPVFQAGALLFVGDGHAAEGAGELTGDALETSMDVEFTVGVISGQRTGGPRAEDSESIMTLGIANSLTDALREATTEMARWLERDYHLTANESAIVLGTSMRYEVAEVVDPMVNVVARIDKSVLGQLSK
jgi:acetamidase/formamidase